MDCKFSRFNLVFDNDERLNAMTLPNKLSYLASTDGANVGNVDLFSLGVARRDFPELISGILENGEGMGLTLKDVEVRKQRIAFILRRNDGRDINLYFMIKGTSGDFQIDKNDYKFAVVKWENGAVHTLQRVTCGEIVDMKILD